jgi:DNA-binding CsgD family transcriptional regulator/tetratricopeptide (TPR) repeat protein
VEILERDPELAVLRSALADAAHGRGSTVLVYGEAGIGKTRLVNEFLALVQGKAHILWSACDDLITPPALGPFREVSRQLGGRVAGLLAAGAPQPDLFSSVLEAMNTKDRPTVVVVEDAHWADAASLDGLKYLGRRMARVSALLVVTFRDDEVPADHPLRYVLGDLPADAVRRVPLSSLSRTAVARFTRRTGYSVDEVIAASRGNPFLLTEFLSSGRERVPASVVDSISARLARCSPEARRVLDLLAVMPGKSERRLLETLVPEAGPALDECRVRGLIDYDRGTAWFRHELARRAAEHLLSEEERRRLHASVLSVLASDAADPALMVHHADAAEDIESLVRFAPVAARQARGVAAHREAASHYRRIMPHLDRYPVSERADLLSEYTVESYLTDDQTAAVEAATRALELRRLLGDAAGEGAMLRWSSRLHWWRGDPTAAEEAAEAAIRVLETIPPSADLAMAYSNMSQLRMLAQDHKPAVGWATKAIATAKAVGDSSSLAHALNNLGSAQLRSGDPVGRELLEESLRLARSEGMDEHAARAMSNLSWTALDYRDYVLAERYIEEGLELAVERELAGYDYYLTAQRARLRLDRGEWDKAEADALWVLARRKTAGITTLPALSVLARVQTRRGDPRAGDTLDEAWAAALPTGELQRIGPVAVGRAEFAWLRADPEAISEAIEPARVLSDRGPQPWVSDELSFWLWRSGRAGPVTGGAEPFALQMSGDWRGAAEAWERVGCPYEQACALADGDSDEALLAALDIFDRLGAVPAAALVRRKMRAAGTARIPRGPRPSTRENPGGLTARQVDVALLVAERMGNTAIAERLFLSAKTVEHHVSAILSKLGLASRDEVAEAVTRLGLIDRSM